jgi:hypothetical protein
MILNEHQHRAGNNLPYFFLPIFQQLKSDLLFYYNYLNEIRQDKGLQGVGGDG